MTQATRDAANMLRLFVEDEMANPPTLDECESIANRLEAQSEPEGVTLAEIHEEIRGLDKTIEGLQDVSSTWIEPGRPGRFLFIVRAALAHAYGEPS